MIMAAIKRPSGKNKNYPKASGIHSQPSNNTRDDRSCACGSAFLGFYGLFGWVRLGMVPRCLTTNRCHRAAAVRMRCNNTL